jgi:hypothetical protein
MKRNVILIEASKANDETTASISIECCTWAVGVLPMPRYEA